MKKLMLILSMLAVLAISGTAMAATKDAEVFSAEQTRVTSWMETLLTKNKPAEAQALMSPQVQQEITVAKITELKKKMDKDLGKLGSVRFVGWTRFDKADQIVYLASFSKEPVVRCVFICSPEGELLTFALTPLQQKEQAADASAAAAKSGK